MDMRIQTISMTTKMVSVAQKESQVLRVLLVPLVYLVLQEKEVLGVPPVHMEAQDSPDHLGLRVQRETLGCLQARLHQERRVTEVHQVCLGRMDFQVHWVLKVIQDHPDRQENKAYQDFLGKPGLQVTLAGRARLGHKVTQGLKVSVVSSGLLASLGHQGQRARKAFLVLLENPAPKEDTVWWVMRGRGGLLVLMAMRGLLVGLA